MSVSLLLAASLLSSIAISDVESQYHALGKCPKLQPLANFQPDQFLGKWFIYKQFRVGVEQNMECKTLDLSPDGNVSFDFYSNSQLYTVLGEFLVDASAKGTMKVVFEYSDVMGSKSDGEVVWQILNTDYKTFAVVAACHEESITHKQYVYVMIRNPILSTTQKALVDTGFKNTHYPAGGGSLEDRNLDRCLMMTGVEDKKEELQKPFVPENSHSNLQYIIQNILSLAKSDGSKSEDETLVQKKPTSSRPLIITFLDGKVTINGNLGTDQIVVNPEMYSQIFSKSLLTKPKSDDFGGSSNQFKHSTQSFPDADDSSPLNNYEETVLKNTYSPTDPYYQVITEMIQGLTRKPSDDKLISLQNIGKLQNLKSFLRLAMKLK